MPISSASLVPEYSGCTHGKQPTLESWHNGYKTLLEEIREFHGNEVPILCVASNADPMLADYVRSVATQSGLRGEALQKKLAEIFE